MTDNTPQATETPQSAQETPEATTEPTKAHQAAQEPQEHAHGDDSGQDTEGQAHPAAEAKRYRLRLRETEAERDNLAAQLEALRKAEAERIAAAEVSNPAGLWAAGTDVADLLTDDGAVDPQKVRQATRDAAEALGLARPKPAAYSPYAGKVPERRNRAADMADVIRG